LTDRRSGGLALPSSIGTTPRRVARVFALVLAGAVLQLLVQTVFARALPREHVGLISLVLGALPILSTLTILGQDSSIVRFFSRDAAGRYDVRRYVVRVLALSAPAGALAGLAAALYYDLPPLAAAAAIALVASQNAVTILTSVARAAHRYERAMLGTRLPFAMAAVALVVLRALDALTLASGLWTLIGAFALAVMSFAATAQRDLRTGDEKVPRSVVVEGLLFFGLSLSFSVMTAADKLVIGRMMELEDLAVYATIYAVMRGFDFLFYSISYVLMPRVNTLGRVPLRRLNLWITGVAALVAAVYLTIGDEVVHLLYAGRYDAGVYLILPFALSGVLKLFYSVPSSVIGGRLPRAALRAFLWFNLGGMVLNVVLDIVLISVMGLLGAAVATAIAWAVRLTGGYLIILRHRKRLGPSGRIGSDGTDTA
jgi:O-antigen/teichoic acid export membrane protein